VFVPPCRTGLQGVLWAVEVRTCAKSEVSSIDTPPKPKVDVQETISIEVFECSPARLSTQ
jgi:hypothetical protein